MTQILRMNRRRFLGTAAASGGLMLSFQMPTVLNAAAKTATAASPTNPDGAMVTVFLDIKADNTIAFYTPFCEMGQGTHTSIPAIIAEELDAELAAMQVIDAPHGKDYQIMFGGSMRFTGGSLSVRSGYNSLRQAGASARDMLIRAAAEQWGVAPADCRTDLGFVLHGDAKLSYGEIADAAGKLEPPQEPTLKSPDQFRYIGKAVKRTDTAAKSNGTAQFGIDVTVPGMLYAAVKQSPVFGGNVKSLDSAAAAAMPGVVAVEQVPAGFAVVAESYWQARTALAAVKVEWNEGDNASLSSAGMLQALQARLDEPGVAAENEGDAATALAAAATQLEAVYEAPLLAHATMEPMNCTAEVRADGCDVWAPNQAPDFVAGIAAGVTGLAPEQVSVHTPFLGGGFGRRFTMADYVTQAVTLSKATGKPVKVVWTREEDLQHDFYRPLATAKLRAGLDADGKPVALHITGVGDGPLRRHAPAFMSDPNIDESVVEGLMHQPYSVANKRTDYVQHDLPLPIGFWRSVGNSQNAFFKESFIDEVAAAAGQEPVEFRRGLLSEQPRYKNVFEAAVAMANYQPGVREVDGGKRAMGVALHESFGSLVAQVADVSIEDGKARVHNVWCAVDPGSIVNPDIVEAQMQSAIAYGLSAALHEQVIVDKGRVQQNNFPDYPILAPSEMPEVAVTIIESGEAMGGIGEPATPPIAPAVGNALAVLTGKRIRSLPFANHQLS